MYQQNIEVIRRTICGGCLSQDRKLFPVEEMKKYAFFCYSMTLDEKDWVCWECRQLILKLCTFRRRVVGAQVVLNELLSGQPCKIKTSSRLSKVTISENTADVEIMQEVDTVDPLYYKLVRDTVNSDDDNDGDGPTTVHNPTLVQQLTIVHNSTPVHKPTIGNKATPVHNPTNDNETTVEETVVEESEHILYECDPNNIPDHVLAQITYEDHTYEVVENVEQLIVAKKKPATVARVTLNSDKPAGAPPPRRSAIQYPRTITKPNEPIPTTVVEDPFTVQTMSQDEMIMFRLRKRGIEFFNSCSPLMRCEECTEPFDSQRAYTAHMKGHTKDYGDLLCEICGLNLLNPSELKLHKKRHYDLLKCKRCEFEWDSPNGMRRHCFDAHSIAVTSWLCDHCPQKYPTQALLMRHSPRHRVKQCPECSMTLRGGIKRHMMRAHKNLPLFECACGLQCKGKSGLLEHKKCCRKVSDETYCAECDLQCRSKYAYRAHLRNTVKHATAERLRFRCAECGKAFLDSTSLTRHTDAVHDRQSKYLCEQCGRSFFTMLARTRHMRRLHSGRPVVKDKICPHCGKAFEVNRALREHMNKHTKARPYKCSCGAAFNYGHGLKKHQQTKHHMPQSMTEQLFI